METARALLSAAAVDPGAVAVDPGDPAVDPVHGHDYDNPAGNLVQPDSQDGGACSRERSLEGSPGYLRGGSTGKAGSVRACAGCGGAPSAGARLQACGRCLSVRYCFTECQAKHWREGGHKEACPRLRDTWMRSKAARGSR